MTSYIIKVWTKKVPPKMKLISLCGSCSIITSEFMAPYIYVGVYTATHFPVALFMSINHCSIQEQVKRYQKTSTGVAVNSRDSHKGATTSYFLICLEGTDTSRVLISHILVHSLSWMKIISVPHVLYNILNENILLYGLAKMHKKIHIYYKNLKKYSHWTAALFSASTNKIKLKSITKPQMGSGRKTLENAAMKLEPWVVFVEYCSSSSSSTNLPKNCRSTCIVQ